MNFLNQIIDLYKIIKLKKLKIDESTTKEKIVEYLNSIPNKYQLSFFDYFHPQISDPGAFVIAQKNNEKYIFQLANHGWSSTWKEIDFEGLIEYIYKNKEFTSDYFVVSKIFSFGVVDKQ
jgi:hypothetical protein